MGNKNTRTTKSLGDLRISGKTPLVIPEKANKDTEVPATPKTLAFKSYRQGTLITQNFEPVPIKSKPLCATSPEFVPAVPLKLVALPPPSLPKSFEATPKKVDVPRSIPNFPAPGMKQFQVHSAIGMPPANTGIGTPVNAFRHMGRASMTTPPGRLEQVIRNTIVSQLTESAPNTPSFPTGTPYRPRSGTFITPAGTGTFNTPNNTTLTTMSPTQPSRPSHLTHRRNRSSRADKSLKDVIVSRHGIKHNIIPNTSSPPSFNLIDTLRSMSGKEREEFWAMNWVEIVVDLNLEEGNGKLENNEKIKQYDVLIQNLELLGPQYKTSVQNMLINIIFPEPPLSPPSANTGSAPPRAPIASATSHTTSEFIHLTNLVTHLSLSSLSTISPLASLQNLTVLLTVPNSSKPLSLPQLTLLLPFYDLPFTSWTISWRTSFMTRAEAVGGWPVHYLDRERKKLLRERERKGRDKMEEGRNGEGLNGARRGSRENSGKGADKGRVNEVGEEGSGLKKEIGVLGG